MVARDEHELYAQHIYKRADWGTSVRLADSLWRIRLKNPKSSLMVNSYVLAAAGEIVVIDPGWPWTLDALEKALVELEIIQRLEDVTTWLYTHTHIDHMGGAALLAFRSAARHLTWSGIAPELLSWHSFQTRMNDWTWWLEQAFAEPARSTLAVEVGERRARRRRTMLSSFGEMSVRNAELFEHGDILELAGSSFEVIDARGHDMNHVAFYERSRGWLIAGDAVIAVPTPICPAMHDDLGCYEGTLTRLEGLGARLLLPGHGTQAVGAQKVREAIGRSRGFVKQYREGVRAALDEREPRGLWELALALTPDHKPLAPQARWWVHLSLVESHLGWLIERGEARVEDLGEGPRYAAL